MHFSDEYWHVSITPTKEGANNRKERGEEWRAAKAHLAAKGMRPDYRYPISQEARATAQLEKLKEALADFPLTYGKPTMGRAFSLSL